LKVLFHKNSEEIVSGYFGKLPEFNDFIKFNAGSSEILYIDNWLQEGIAQAKAKFKAEWKVNYDSLPPTGFSCQFPSPIKSLPGCFMQERIKADGNSLSLYFSIVAGKQFELFYLMPAEIERILSGWMKFKKRRKS